MNWNEWEPWYKKILADFGYSEEKDREAANIALRLAKNPIGEEEIKKLIEGKIVTICGAAIRQHEIDDIHGTVMAADETTSILLENDVLPDIITTDLDGKIEDLIEASRKGSVIILHAHGDNIDKIYRWLPYFGKIMLTTQAKPSGKIYNFGGFTDGDRAYCIARHFNAKEIFLLGFDFENVVEKEGKDSRIKKRKLEWARRIIETC